MSNCTITTNNAQNISLTDVSNNLWYSNNSTINPYKITDIKTFKLGDINVYVQNCNNKLVRVSELVTQFTSTDTGNNVQFFIGGFIDFKNLEDAKNYIIRIKKQYKKMKALDKQLDIDADFE